MRIGAMRFAASAASASGERDARAHITELRAKLAAFQSIVDDLNVGIVLLDKELRVQFINRRFRRFWRVPDEMVTADLSFVRLMYQDRGVRAYAVSQEHLGDYVTMQLALIRAGEQGPRYRYVSPTARSFSSAATR